jgi:hypothetical protein
MSDGIVVVVPEDPLFVTALAAQVAHVGLGQPAGDPVHRVFICLDIEGLPSPLAVQISLDGARFLRDSLDLVLDRHQAMAQPSN